MVFKPEFTENAPKDKDDVVKVQVTLTKGCHRVIKQYAAMKGMTMSQVFYLATRYSLHREAVKDLGVRNMMEREGIPLDQEVVKEWLEYVKEQTMLEEVFDPMPAEAL